MYQIFKNGLSMWIVSNEPTQEQLEDLGCDSYAQYEQIETEQEKKNRVRNNIVTTQDISSIDLDWTVFSDIEIGDIIVEKVFGWNHHAQTALQAKYIIALTNKVMWIPLSDDDIRIFEKTEAARTQVNEIRLKLSLDNI